ncbi:MAG: hypothetical protein GC185_11715 [Alphaproteobacteria bacterium]|nr:hypothetical protein [Alphaproteobacteria bacterium]
MFRNKKLPFPKPETAKDAPTQAVPPKPGFMKRALARKAPWYVKALRTALLVTVAYPALQVGLMGLPGRAETPGERAMLQPIFQSAVDYDKARVHSSAAMDFLVNPFGGLLTDTVSLAHTRGDVIVMGRDSNRPDYSSPKVDDETRMIFIHENVHIWQFQNRPFTMTMELIGDMYNKLAGVNQTYDYTLKPGRDLLDYSVEQQATIITDYYMNVSKGKQPEFAENKESGAALKQLYDSTLKNFKANPKYIAGRGFKF